MKKKLYAGDKVGFFRTVKKGSGTQTKPARGRILWIKDGQVAINFRGRLYMRTPDQLNHIVKEV